MFTVKQKTNNTLLIKNLERVNKKVNIVLTLEINLIWLTKLKKARQYTSFTNLDSCQTSKHMKQKNKIVKYLILTTVTNKQNFNTTKY